MQHFYLSFLLHTNHLHKLQKTKKTKNNLEFLAETPLKNEQTANHLSEPIDGHSLKVSTKNYRGRVKNKRDERANDYMSSYKGALVGNIPNNILNAKKASINEFFKA